MEKIKELIGQLDAELKAGADKVPAFARARNNLELVINIITAHEQALAEEAEKAKTAAAAPPAGSAPAEQ